MIRRIYYIASELYLQITWVHTERNADFLCFNHLHFGSNSASVFLDDVRQCRVHHHCIIVLRCSKQEVVNDYNTSGPLHYLGQMHE